MKAIAHIREFFYEFLTSEKGYRTNPAWRRGLRGFRIAPIQRCKIAVATMRLNQTRPLPSDPSIPQDLWKARCREHDRVGDMRKKLVKWGNRKREAA